MIDWENTKFVHVGKTGGGFLKHVFSHNGIKLGEQFGHFNISRGTGNSIITIIRDPVCRFLSCLNWLYTRPFRMLNDMEVQLIDEFGFDNIDPWIENIDRLEHVHHVTSTRYVTMIGHLMPVINKTNIHLLSTVNLSDDIQKKLQLDIPEKLSCRAHVSVKCFDESQLSRRHVNIIKNFFKTDYDIINRLQQITKESIINI